MRCGDGGIARGGSVWRVQGGWGSGSAFLTAAFFPVYHTAILDSSLLTPT